MTTGTGKVQTDASPDVDVTLPDGSTLAKETTQTSVLASLGSILAKLSADPATQTTLAALLAKVIAAPATEAKQDTGNTSLATVATNTGTIRHATTPSKADAAAGPIEVARTGVTYVGASLRCTRKLALATAAGAWTGFASLAEGACDALRTDTDSLIIYKQPTERDPLALQTAAAWGSAAPPAGWTFAGTVATHAAAGGTTSLTQDTSSTHAADPLLVNEYYAVVFTISGRTAGTVTPKIGTTAGSARSTNGTYIEIIQAQSAVLTFTPTTDFDGAIDVASAWAIPGTLPVPANVWEPYSAIKVVCAALSTSPGTISSTAKISAGWYRRAGAVELT